MSHAPQPHQAATSSGALHFLQSKLKDKKVILVQGACGTLGTNIVKVLCKNIKDKPNYAVVAGVSNMDEPNTQLLKEVGVDIIHLDLHNHELVKNAFAFNVDTVVVIPPYINNRVPLVSRLLDVAREKNVKHIVFLTPFGTFSEEIEIFKHLNMLQNRIRSFTDIRHTLIGSQAYMDNLFHLKELIKQGTLGLPTGDGKWAPIWTVDVAEFVVKMILEPKGEPGSPNLYDICGPTLMSGQEMAQIISKSIGKTVNYVAMSPDEWRTIATQQGMPSYKAEDLRDLYQWYSKGNAQRTTNTFENVCGHKPKTLEEFIKTNLTQFQ